MLQWMGGGRRKVKTTKKSIQARQHQFFEQRRQQLRSQAAKELIPDKVSRPHENIYSLDIASLKNLSQLARQYGNDQPEGTKSISFCAPKPDDFWKTKCFEGNAGICQTNDLHCKDDGYQPETMVDAAAHSRATVGTQWTPASAAAAASLSHHEPGIFPQEPPLIPVKEPHVQIENSKREERTLKVQANPKQEKNAKNNLGKKILSRHQKFEKFQILDLLNGSQDGVERKKDARSEHYAAYVLEGMGHVPNCTPKNDDRGCNKTRNEVELPARKFQHGTQLLPHSVTEDLARRRKGKVHVQRHSFSTMDEERDAVTNLQSFSDSNGNQCSGECHLRKCYSRKDQSPGEMNIWTRVDNVDPHSDRSSGRALFKERDVLGLDYIARLPSSIYNIGLSYPKVYESPESGGFTVEERNPFSICSDYGSTNISFETDNYNSYNFLQNDDDLREVCSSPDSDGMTNFQSRDSTDEILPMDDYFSPDASPLSCGKAAYDFTFNSPAAETFSESTFEFKGTILKSSVFETDFQSPSLWEKKLNASYGSVKDSEAASFSLKRITNVDLSPLNSQDDDEFKSANEPQQESTEISVMGHLTENHGFTCNNLIETESSSLDTLFGTSVSGFPSSPTSPLLNQSCHLKSSHGAEILRDCMDDSFVQKVTRELKQKKKARQNSTD